LAFFDFFAGVMEGGAISAADRFLVLGLSAQCYDL